MPDQSTGIADRPLPWTQNLESKLAGLHWEGSNGLVSYWGMPPIEEIEVTQTAPNRPAMGPFLQGLPSNSTRCRLVLYLSNSLNRETKNGRSSCRD